MKVLVVDDNINARKLLAKILVSNGYEAFEVTDGNEALEFLKDTKPGLIISDIMMPNMDGFTLIKEVKSNPDTKDIPFVFYTAHYVSEQDHLLATSLGASRFIVKPAEPHELLHEVQNVLDEYAAGLIKPEEKIIGTDEEYYKQYSERVVRKLEDKYGELEKTTNFLNAVLENMCDCVVVVDPQLNVTYYNHKVSEAMGCDIESGKKLPDFMSRHVINAKSNSENVFETRLIKKDKTVIYLEGTISVNINEGGDSTGYTLVFRDVTKRKQAEKELLNTKLEAESLSRAKSEFLDNMSHELRTPLTAIIGFSDVLCTGMSGDLNEKQLGYANHIAKSGKHLLEVINDILNVSKLETCRMELECEIFSIMEVLDDVFAIFSPMAQGKNIDLRLDSDIQVDEIYGDRLKFKLVMSNLLSNAIKFTPNNGKVLVTAEKNDDKLHVSVSDSGIGIPEHKLKQIFDPFIQADSSNARTYGGTGLGLTLVKWFVELHNGTIHVESEEGAGSTFAFTIEDQGFVDR
ncbi:ATP-binding protein [Methanolobus vulcani]|uniref:histidine kinase n=1 Tax=Methanolobus vulcani TaxID=38026 RepID=A0A7Z8P0E6_9EURY|nr:ATP-binding protein [Methanolobus vulcani]TQD23824.1 response regulator [Methanolobus vulcani]